MGIRNYLVEGVSATGKTSVCHELRRRGYHALNGDRALAFKGDPATGKPVIRPRHANEIDSIAWVHAHQIWDVDKVKNLVADHSSAMTFFCGGSRNFTQFVEMFDAVFVLDIDAITMRQRLSERPYDEFGGRQSERELILRLHATKEDIPRSGIVIDEILKKCG